MRDYNDCFSYFPKGAYELFKASILQDECCCKNRNNNNGLDAFKYYLNNKFGLSSRLPEVHHILVNGDTTTFIWENGTHTIVKLAEGEDFDIDTAYCYAIVKKMTGNTGGSMKRYFDELHKKTIVKQEKSSPLYDKLKDLLKYLKKD